MLSAGLLLLAACGTQQSHLDIIGGTPPSGNHPGRASTVLVLLNGKPFCTGVLVASNTVITAGHCIESSSPSDYRIFFGPDFVSDPSKDLTHEVIAVRAMKPGKRNYPNLDIAWIRFAGSAPAGFHPVKILADQSRLARGDVLIREGYGTRNPEEQNPGLLTTVTGTFDHIENSHLYHYLLITGWSQGKTTCYGDSGGPAYANIDGVWHLVGTVNGQEWHDDLAPDQDCRTGISVYTFVGAFKSWFEQSAGIELSVTGQTPEFSPIEGKTFEELCGDITVDHETWYSVRKVLEALDLKSCPEAAKRLETVPRLSVYDATDLRVLNGAMQLRELSWTESDTADLSGLSVLKNLSTLDLSSNNISGLGAFENLANLANLDTLRLRSNKISDLSPLVSLVRLASLDVSYNSVLDISPLAKLAQLRDLSAERNAISDLAPLANFRNMYRLNVSANQIGDITPLQSLAGLWQLDLSENKIRNIDALAALTRLEYLDLSDNMITSLAPLQNIKSLKEAKTTGNPLAP